MNKRLPALLLFCSVAAGAQFQTDVQVLDNGDQQAVLRKWRAMARHGDPAAQFNLALIYAAGQGVPEDDSIAVQWYRLAAEQGHAKAQLNLGYMYSSGRGVPRDLVAAVKWFRMAAKQGHAVAQANLGRQYYQGEGVPEDYVRSYAWFSLAAAQGDRESLKNKSIIIEIMTPTQVAEAQSLSRQLCAGIQTCSF